MITQWPGISAEQIEQQVTIPLETAMNGIPGVVHLRSFSLFGLSDLKLIFEDGTDNAWNRERVLERLSQVMLPPERQPADGHRLEPGRPDLFLHLHSTNPAYDAMELKSIEDWVVEKNLKSVPDIVDVASFGGPTREYQVRLDPNKLVAYGLSLAQIEQQLTNNNANAGGSFIQQGLQQINVREVGLVSRVHDIEETVVYSQKRHTAPHQRSLPSSSRGRRSGSASSPARARLVPMAPMVPSSMTTARSSTTMMSSPASRCCGKAPTPILRSAPSTKKSGDERSHPAHPA